MVGVRSAVLIHVATTSSAIAFSRSLRAVVKGRSVAMAPACSVALAAVG